LTSASGPDFTSPAFAAPPPVDLAQASPAAGASQAAAAAAAASDNPALPTEDDVAEALRDVIDPELGINVVDLGLLYGVDIQPDGHVRVDMTLTSAACPLTDMIESQAAASLEGMAASVVINWVWTPPWGPDRISEDGREQLRALGFNV